MLIAHPLLIIYGKLHFSILSLRPSTIMSQLAASNMLLPNIGKVINNIISLALSILHENIRRNLICIFILILKKTMEPEMRCCFELFSLKQKIKLKLYLKVYIHICELKNLNVIFTIEARHIPSVHMFLGTKNRAQDMIV